ncbi:MAG: lytic murein transglycosylase [Actinomycetales bacterium]
MDSPSYSDATPESGALRTVHLRWRGVAAALPALALLGGGLALAGSGAPAGPTRGAGASVTKGATLPIVPDTPFAMPGTADGAPGLNLPPTGPGGAGSPVLLDAQGIPGVALAAYHRAAGVIGNADPACRIDWALIAAVGRVESDHGRYGGNALGVDGIDRPGVYGVALDGTGGTATIPDTDNGVYDHDKVWDRAVGPMQFIPGTWRSVGGDLDGDGAKNPQDIDDAAAATAIYLCAGPGNLSDPSDAYSAVRRYNNSDSYARTVLAIADAYRHGVTMLPLGDQPAASSSSRSTSSSGQAEARRSPGAGPGAGKGSGSGSGATAGGGSGAGAGIGGGSGAGGGSGSSAPDPVSSVVNGVTSHLPPVPTPVSSVVCTIVNGVPVPVPPLPPLPLPTPTCPASPAP